LVLRDDVKENLLADLREFLDNEEWYTLAGVPYRRGMSFMILPENSSLPLIRIPTVWQTWNRQELDYSCYGNVSFSPFISWL
jgi:hypothetical protein